MLLAASYFLIVSFWLVSFTGEETIEPVIQEHRANR